MKLCSSILVASENLTLSSKIVSIYLILRVRDNANINEGFYVD